MAKAICFECKKPLPIKKTMEELLKANFPVFCSVECSVRFPKNNTENFRKRMAELI